MAAHNAAASVSEPGPARATAYGWLVFALAFGLLISDYMARQVLNAVFPLLKAQWSLSDTELGWLSGAVAVMVGVLTVPFSLLADRWGRVKSLTVMAVLWSLATLLCAVARTYPEMLTGRVLVGVGEAAYGSVGIALVISVFPQSMRATLASAFMAGGLFGQVLGVALGGQIAASHGWRAAFFAIGLSGLVLALMFPLLVRPRKVAALSGGDTRGPEEPAVRPRLRELIASRTVVLAYIGSGLQLFGAAAVPAWLPTFLGRYYAMPVDRAGRTAAVFFLISSGGMILCGVVSDRLARDRPERKITLAIGYCLTSGAALFLAMQCAPGAVQYAILALAMFFAAGTTGPVGAMVANLTPRPLHGSAFATLTLVNNLIGLATGPIITGRLADSFGLATAFMTIPLTSLAAAAVFALARRTYLADLAKLGPDPARASA